MLVGHADRWGSGTEGRSRILGCADLCGIDNGGGMLAGDWCEGGEDWVEGLGQGLRFESRAPSGQVLLSESFTFKGESCLRAVMRREI